MIDGIDAGGVVLLFLTGLICLAAGIFCGRAFPYHHEADPYEDRQNWGS